MRCPGWTLPAGGQWYEGKIQIENVPKLLKMATKQRVENNGTIAFSDVCVLWAIFVGKLKENNRGE